MARRGQTAKWTVVIKGVTRPLEGTLHTLKSVCWGGGCAEWESHVVQARLPESQS